MQLGWDTQQKEVQLLIESQSVIQIDWQRMNDKRCRIWKKISKLIRFFVNGLKVLNLWCGFVWFDGFLISQSFHLIIRWLHIPVYSNSQSSFISLYNLNWFVELTNEKPGIFHLHSQFDLQFIVNSVVFAFFVS